jgi:protein phosphatase
MVRFDEIRDVLQRTTEPIEACKQLTERANQAGGHDNITVILVQFDGEGLKPIDADAEPLQYRKYALPEEVTDNTEPHRRFVPDMPSALPGVSPSLGPGSSAPQGLGTTIVHSGAQASPVPPFIPAARMSSRPPPVYEEERIEIPGTHVPAWVVVALVVGVMGALWAAAVLLLR